MRPIKELVVPDLDALPGAVMLTERQVEALSGLSAASLRTWRCRKNGGPAVTYIQGRPRYSVNHVRLWMGLPAHINEKAA